jgi:hypothetical protein
VKQRNAARVSAESIRFAEEGVRDKPPLYRELSHGVAGGPEIIGFL